MRAQFEAWLVGQDKETFLAGLAYINECEHQDGSGYWSNFTTLAEVIEDFELYRNFPLP